MLRLQQAAPPAVLNGHRRLANDDDSLHAITIHSVQHGDDSSSSSSSTSSQVSSGIEVEKVSNTTNGGRIHSSFEDKDCILKTVEPGYSNTLFFPERRYQVFELKNVSMVIESTSAAKDGGGELVKSSAADGDRNYSPPATSSSSSSHLNARYKVMLQGEHNEEYLFIKFYRLSHALETIDEINSFLLETDETSDEFKLSFRIQDDNSIIVEIACALSFIAWVLIGYGSVKEIITFDR